MGKKEGEDPVHSESKFLNVVIFPISGMPGRLSFQMQERWVVLKAAVLVLIRDLWLFILWQSMICLDFAAVKIRRVACEMDVTCNS